jgi:crossover junction endodeoxyribonuclease RusA
MTPSIDTSDRARGASEVRLALSWPDKGLSPNARLHWARKAKLVKAARHDAWVSTLVLRRRLGGLGDGPINLTVEFCPPDHRRRDRDNLIASMKAANDGIADALGVDDSRFVSTYSMGPPVKGGSVLVTVRAA